MRPLTLPQTRPGFLRVCSTSLLKTLWEKEKLLVTSNFSFSRSVFYPFWRTFCHFVLNLKLSSPDSFSLDQSQNLSFGKGLKCCARLMSRSLRTLQIKISLYIKGSLIFDLHYPIYATKKKESVREKKRINLKKSSSYLYQQYLSQC